MKLFLASDLHLDTYKNPYTIMDIVCSKSDTADVLVIAGDTAEGRNSIWLEAMQVFASHFKKVFFTLSNHFYYGSLPSEIESVAYEADSWDNVHLLHYNTVEIDGVVFGGCPLWFRPDPYNALFARGMGDFSQIKEFVPWVYNENARALAWFAGFTKASRPDVVVTHHMPSHKCINLRFLKSAINRFFVCDIEDWIVDRQPKLILSGHTHNGYDFKINETRLIANPYGYPMESTYRSFNSELTIEV